MASTSPIGFAPEESDDRDHLVQPRTMDAAARRAAERTDVMLTMLVVGGSAIAAAISFTSWVLLAR